MSAWPLTRWPRVESSTPAIKGEKTRAARKQRGITGFGLSLLCAAGLRVAELKAASVNVTFTFTRVVELQCDEGIGESCPNDYYPKVDIDAQGLDDGKSRFCCAHGTD